MEFWKLIECRSVHHRFVRFEVSRAGSSNRPFITGYHHPAPLMQSIDQEQAADSISTMLGCRAGIINASFDHHSGSIMRDHAKLTMWQEVFCVVK